MKKFTLKITGHSGQLYDEAGEEANYIASGTAFYLASDVDEAHGEKPFNEDLVPHTHALNEPQV